MAESKLIKIGDFGTVNVVEDAKYNWTVSNKPIARSEVPRIEIREFQQSASSIRQAIQWYATRIKSIREGGIASDDPYDQLYAVDKSEHGNTYYFPYYNIYHHSVQNAWGENAGTIGSAIAGAQKFATEVARVVYPNAGIEGAKAFEGSTPATYSFTFQLLNTVDPSNDIKNNRELIRALIHNNLLDKVNLIGVRPPAICTIYIPGIREKTIGVMSNILIENLGQLNYMPQHEGSIPDAYGITITIQELLTESRQIWSKSITNKGDKVFADVKDLPTEAANVFGGGNTP